MEANLHLIEGSLMVHLAFDKVLFPSYIGLGCPIRCCWLVVESLAGKGEGGWL